MRKSTSTQKSRVSKAGTCNYRRFVLLFISMFLLFSIKIFPQANLNNIKVWEGWKLGNVIKVSGTIKYGDPLSKAGDDKRYLIVQKIDEQPLDSSRTILITCNNELLSSLKNNDTVTFLGYVGGSYGGIPTFNDYEIEYWQDEAFHFEFNFVVLKADDEIKSKKK